MGEHVPYSDDLCAVADRQAILALIYRYSRSVDRLDVPLGHSIWHDDGVADYGPVYKGPGKGVIDLICERHGSTMCTTHQVTNVIIDLEGDRAGSEAYVTATLRAPKDDVLEQITVWGRYVDRWSRRDGRWGLDKRVFVRDFDEVREVREMARYNEGRRDRGDPSYFVLNGD